MKPKKQGTKTKKGFPAAHEGAVEQMVQGLRPVKAPMPIGAQWFCWAAAMALLTWFCLSRISLRDDFQSDLSSLAYDLLVAFVFVGAALAAWGAIEASIPAGESKGKWKVRGAFLLYGSAFLLFVLFLPWDMVNYPHHDLHLSCFMTSLMVGVVAWIGLGLILRHNAPLKPLKVGLWAGISSFLLGLGVCTLHCGSHNFAHVCLEHFLPVLAYSGLVGLLGYRWLCAWKQKPLSK